MEGKTKPCLRFAEDELTDPRLEKPIRKAEKAAVKLEKAQGRLPKQKRIAIARAADEATGKSIVRLRFDEQIKPPSRLVHEALPGVGGEIHRQIGKLEDDNTGVQAAHGAEQTTESAVRLVAHSSRAAKLKAYRHAEQAEQALDRVSLRVLYRKERLSSNPFSRWQQKRAIRRGYMTGKAAGGSAAQGAVQARGVTQRAKQGLKALVTRNKKTFLLGGALFLMIAFVMNGLSSCTPLVQGALQAFVIATYPAEDEDILAAERYYKGLENELQSTIDRYAADHPQYDEFQYELDDIWHDPHALISLVSAHANGEWKINEVYGYMDRLFAKQYMLTQKVESETRYRMEWVTHHYKEVDEDTGEVTWMVTFERIPYGHYTIVETQPLPGYLLSVTEIRLTVDGEYVNPTETVAVVNVPNHYSFLKVDNESHPLSGVKFALEDADGNVLRELVSGEDGVVRVNELRGGSYTIRETEALEGYIRSEEVIRLVIDDAYTVPEEMYRLVNYPGIQTGVDIAMTPVMWAGAALVVAGALVAVYIMTGKKKEHRRKSSYNQRKR